MQIEIKITNWSDDSRVDLILSSENAKSALKSMFGKPAKTAKQIMVMLTETFYEHNEITPQRTVEEFDKECAVLKNNP